MVDRRVNRTKRLIKEAFIDLIAEQSLHTIMVSEVAERADVGRSTFYKYYDNVGDLFEQLSDGLIDDLVVIMIKDLEDHLEFDPERLMHKVINYVEENSRVLTLFIREGDHFVQDMKQTFCNELIESQHIASDDYNRRMRIAFTVDAVVDILARWQLSSEKKGGLLG